MKSPEAPKYILETERAVLQAMCTVTPDRAVWDDGMRLLRSYRFRNVIHQVIFDALCEMNTDKPNIIREQLLVRLMRKGFPDVDVSVFLGQHSLPAEAVGALIRSLCATASDTKGPESSLP